MKNQLHQNNQKERVMIDFILEQLITWWQFTTVGILIIIGFIINLFGVDNKKKRIGFEYTEMPHMQPIIIPTDGNFFLITLIALQTRLLGFKASDPILSFLLFGVFGNNATIGILYFLI